jgi:hypothetical protein
MNCNYHPEVPSSAFCQFCGKPLCKDCVRNVGGSVFCEACLAERLRGTGIGARRHQSLRVRRIPCWLDCWALSPAWAPCTTGSTPRRLRTS